MSRAIRNVTGDEGIGDRVKAAAQVLTDGQQGGTNQQQPVEGQQTYR